MTEASTPGPMLVLSFGQPANGDTGPGVFATVFYDCAATSPTSGAVATRGEAVASLSPVSGGQPTRGTATST